MVPLSPKEGSRNSMRPQRMIVIGLTLDFKVILGRTIDKA